MTDQDPTRSLPEVPEPHQGAGEHPQGPQPTAELPASPENPENPANPASPAQDAAGHGFWQSAPSGPWQPAPQPGDGQTAPQPADWQRTDYGQWQHAPYGQWQGAQQPGGWQGGPYGPWVAAPQPGQWQGAEYGQPWWAPPQVAAPDARKRHHRRVLIGSLVGATATAVAVAVIATSVAGSSGTRQTASSGSNGGSSPFSNGQTDPNPNYGWGNPFGSGGGNSSGGTNSTGTATAQQQVGVVDINTELNYGQGKAAGTGIVLSSSGEILTNNHVVDSSTSISVTVVSTGKTYTATVVGTDPTEDVAVLQLKDASGLATAKVGDSSKVTVGNTVTAVGNAGGTGGTPSAATGTVTALGQSITASDANGSNAERLTGLIQVDADIQAGDSGGPLFATDNSVIGMDTAASSSQSATVTGFAIPIATATSIADKIESGHASSTIHLGYPAFLGVQLQPSGQAAGGAAIAGVVDGSAAAKAGLAAGDTITGLDGTSIASASDLSTAMAQHKPGQQVKLTWTDTNGQSHSATVTLGSGPAD